MNKENLLKLANYLEQLPEDYDHFDMYSFASDGITPQKIHTEINQCGTVACAVGHAPIALNLSEKDIKDMDWRDIADYYLIDRREDEWDWCFSQEWQSIDNTAKGAAKRIKTLLEKGLPPYDKEGYDMDRIFHIGTWHKPTKKMLLDWYK